MTEYARPGQYWLGRNHAWLLIVATVALFATKTLFNYPLGLMTILGVILLIRRPHALWDWGNPAIRTLTLMFLCLWIPMMLSLPDAVDRGRAVGTALTEVRFLFAGLWAIYVLRNPLTRSRAELAFFLLYTFWGADALLQFFAGRDIFGYPYDGHLLMGAFYPKATMGLVMGTLLPLYYEALRRRMHKHPWIIALVLIAWAAILLSENRTSWFMAGLGTLGYAFYLFRVARRIAWPRVLALAVAGAVVLGAFATQYAPLRNKFIITSGLFSGDYKAIDKATSYRLSLWRTALNMYEAHWLNGVGPRGYRYVYKDYAAKDDWWLRHDGKGQTHPHQTTLEIAAETGTFGLIGYALLWLILYRYYRRRDIRIEEKPWAIAMVVAMFPLNVHMAFYASYWGSVYWWIICLGLAASRPARSTPAAP